MCAWLHLCVEIEETRIWKEEEDGRKNELEDRRKVIENMKKEEEDGRKKELEDRPKVIENMKLLEERRKKEREERQIREMVARAWKLAERQKRLNALVARQKRELEDRRKGYKNIKLQDPRKPVQHFDPADWAMVNSITPNVSRWGPQGRYDATYKGRVVCTHIPDFAHGCGGGREGNWSVSVINARFELNQSGEVWVLATRRTDRSTSTTITEKEEMKARIGVWSKYTTHTAEPKKELKEEEKRRKREVVDRQKMASRPWQKDVHNGKPYWINVNTGETVFADPYNQQSPPAASSAAVVASSEAAALPMSVINPPVGIDPPSSDGVNSSNFDANSNGRPQIRARVCMSVLCVR